LAFEKIADKPLPILCSSQTLRLEIPRGRFQPAARLWEGVNGSSTAGKWQGWREELMTEAF